MKTYTVTDVQPLTADTVCITLRPDGEPIDFEAGQYVQAAFEADDIVYEFHPFSIVSSPQAPYVRLMIKALGDYTQQLLGLKTGDKAYMKGPYGTFSAAAVPEQKQVWIAAGIAIAPFLSMAETVRQSGKQVHIYHFVRSRDDALGLARLREISAQTGLDTLQVSVHVGGYNQDILARIFADNNGAGVLVCGGAELRRQARQVADTTGYSGRLLFDDFVTEPAGSRAAA